MNTFEYKFPKITNITDILPAIKDSPEFIVAEKDGYTVINYMVVTEDTFPVTNPAGGSQKDRETRALRASLRREARGIKFDFDTGNIIARPYHKFFNVDERAETMFEKVDLSKPHVVYEKLDGSMVHPMLVCGHLRWATKMGITDTSMQAEEYIANSKLPYEEFAKYLIGKGMTPIFEWCSNKNRIVLSYPTDQLILTAVRNMESGEYINLESIDTNVIPIVPKVDKPVDTIRNTENMEGIVIRFDTGHMLKLKSEWYVLRHNSKEAIIREKNVFKYCMEDKIDDIIPFLTEDDGKKLWDFYYKLDAKLIGLATKLELEFVDLNSEAKGSRKTFAELNKGVHKQFMFKILDGHNIYDTLKSTIAAKCGTQTGVDSIRYLVDDLKWNYEGDNNGC